MTRGGISLPVDYWTAVVTEMIYMLFARYKSACQLQARAQDGVIQFSASIQL